MQSKAGWSKHTCGHVSPGAGAVGRGSSTCGSRGTSFPRVHRCMDMTLNAPSVLLCRDSRQHAAAAACETTRDHPTASMSSSTAGRPDQKDMDPILRNALRYTVSPREYQLLHQYLLSRAPVVRKRTPPPKKYNAIVKEGDDYNAAAVRASLRLAVVTFSGLKAWELVRTRLLSRGPPSKR